MMSASYGAEIATRNKGKTSHTSSLPFWNSCYGRANSLIEEPNQTYGGKRTDWL
jgi:hypothetical protein